VRTISTFKSPRLLAKRLIYRRYYIFLIAFVACNYLLFFILFRHWKFIGLILFCSVQFAQMIDWSMPSGQNLQKKQSEGVSAFFFSSALKIQYHIVKNTLLQTAFSAIFPTEYGHLKVYLTPRVCLSKRVNKCFPLTLLFLHSTFWQLIRFVSRTPFFCTTWVVSLS